MQGDRWAPEACTFRQPTTKGTTQAKVLNSFRAVGPSISAASATTRFLRCDQTPMKTANATRISIILIEDRSRPRGHGKGLPERVLNAFMRHSSATTTRKYYQHQERMLDGVLGEMFVPDVTKNKVVQ